MRKVYYFLSVLAAALFLASCQDAFPEAEGLVVVHQMVVPAVNDILSQLGMESFCLSSPLCLVLESGLRGMKSYQNLVGFQVFKTSDHVEGRGAVVYIGGFQLSLVAHFHVENFWYAELLAYLDIRHHLAEGIGIGALIFHKLFPHQTGCRLGNRTPHHTPHKIFCYVEPGGGEAVHIMGKDNAEIS